jgi:glutaconate CoA-transferase subunit A
MRSTTVEELVAGIRPGELVAIPPDYSGVSLAATRALVARGTGGLRLLAVPTSGLQADLLIGAGLVAEIEAAAVMLGEHGAAPRFAAAAVSGAVRVRDTTCPAVHAALQAAEKGLPYLPLTGLAGSDLVGRRDDWLTAPDPFGGPAELVLLPAIRPDVALFHAVAADAEGNVWIGRRRELATMAHASARTLVTVEEIVPGSLLEDEETAAGTLSALYVTAVAHAPLGAWPVGLAGSYDADDAELARYAAAARSEDGFRAYTTG